MFGFVVTLRTGKPVTVRLSPLTPEHYLPMIGDLVVFAVAYGVWLGVGLPDNGWAVIPILCIPVLGHVIQMTLLVNVRFDDAGLTIIRPWGRRRFEWEQVAGLVWTWRPTGTPGSDPYVLRLVLTGHEPPYGRFLTGSEQERYARGAPVVMRANAMAGDPSPRRPVSARAAECQERVLAELERHGLPRPAPRFFEFRIRGQDPEQAELARAADFIRRRDAVGNAPGQEPA